MDHLTLIYFISIRIYTCFENIIHKIIYRFESRPKRNKSRINRPKIEAKTKAKTENMLQK